MHLAELRLPKVFQGIELGTGFPNGHSGVSSHISHLRELDKCGISFIQEATAVRYLVLLSFTY